VLFFRFLWACVRSARL